MKKIAAGIVVLVLVLSAAYYFLKYRPAKQKADDLAKLIKQKPSFDPASGKTPAQIETWAGNLTDSEYKAVSAFLSATGSEKQNFATAASKMSLTVDQVTTLIKSAIAKLK